MTNKSIKLSALKRLICKMWMWKFRWENWSAYRCFRFRQINFNYRYFRQGVIQAFLSRQRRTGQHKEIKGIENIDKVIAINQSPIGRTLVLVRPHTPASLL